MTQNRIRIVDVADTLVQYRIILSADTESNIRQLPEPISQIILAVAMMSMASNGNSESLAGAAVTSARASTQEARYEYRNPALLSMSGSADAVPQLPKQNYKPQIVNCAVLI